jgi:hypothetical protein
MPLPALPRRLCIPEFSNRVKSRMGQQVDGGIRIDKERVGFVFSLIDVYNIILKPLSDTQRL